MNPLNKLLLARIPVIGLPACGGGDTEDRLDVADPVVRFVHASPIAPNLTLYRGTVPRSDVTDVPYTFASNDFNVDMGVADWVVKTARNSLTLGTVSIDPARATKYTIVALPASDTVGSTYVIVDPYNKALASDSTHLRVMNASFNASNIGPYMNSAGTDITTAGVNPLIAATAYKTSGPASGSYSTDIPGGTYQLKITTAGTKTILFRGQLSFASNKDILLLSVPDSASPGGIKALVKA